MRVDVFEIARKYASGFDLGVENLAIADRERVGIVGNNGAGKTTLLRLMLGLLKLQHGDVRLDGESVRAFSLSWRSRTASYFDESSLLPFLNPWEFWDFVGSAYGLDCRDVRERLYAYGGFIELAAGPRRKSKFIRDYSEGNRKKIGLVAAMIVRPSLLVLDEPFTMLDPRSRSTLEDMLLTLNEECGTTLVISSHDLENIFAVARRVLLLETGRISLDRCASSGVHRQVRERLTRRSPASIQGGI